MALTTEQARNWLAYLTTMLKPSREGNMESGTTQQQESYLLSRYIGTVAAANRVGIVIEGDDHPFLFHTKRPTTSWLPSPGERITLLLNDNGLIEDWQPFDMDAHIDRIEDELSKPLAHPEGHPSPELRLQCLTIACQWMGTWADSVEIQPMFDLAERIADWCYRT